MGALRRLKLSVLQGSRALGVFRAVRNSGWRSSHLLILCYHGISIEDEHDWAPGLFMSPAALAARLDLLDRLGCTVLALDEALPRLLEGTLPPRSVVITFDDGNFDFAYRAWPELKKRRQPATVYLTTYYCAANLPVFPVMISYLLWKARGKVGALRLPTGDTVKVQTASHQQRYATHQLVVRAAQSCGLEVIEKDTLATRLADVLEIDYDAIKKKRILHLMTPDEVRDIAASGADIQLHTHRHRSPAECARYKAEIAANRDYIAPLIGRTPRHFCYPSGMHRPEFAQWLREEGVTSATTCQPGLARRNANLYTLPRLLDHSELTPLEFEAWLSGVAALLPRRRPELNGVDVEGRPTLLDVKSLALVNSLDSERHTIN